LLRSSILFACPGPPGEGMPVLSRGARAVIRQGVTTEDRRLAPPRTRSGPPPRQGTLPRCCVLLFTSCPVPEASPRQGAAGRPKPPEGGGDFAPECGRGSGPMDRSLWPLPAEAESFDQGPVPVDVRLLQVVQQAAAPADEQQQAASAVVVVLVHL